MISIYFFKWLVLVYYFLQHTHLAGVQVSTKIVRNNEEIGYLFQNKYYDFNFQNTYNLNPEVVVKSVRTLIKTTKNNSLILKFKKKGDELITKCVYNSKGRSKFTYGGVSTEEEMCKTWLWAKYKTLYLQDFIFFN